MAQEELKQSAGKATLGTTSETKVTSEGFASNSDLVALAAIALLLSQQCILSECPFGEAENKAGRCQSSCSSHSTTGSSSAPKNPRHSQATGLPESRLNRPLLREANTEEGNLKQGETKGRKKGKKANTHTPPHKTGR